MMRISKSAGAMHHAPLEGSRHDGRGEQNRLAMAGRLEKAKVGPAADWCKTIGPTWNASNGRLKAHSFTTVELFVGTSLTGLLDNDSSTKRRHLHLLPCWTDAGKTGEISFRSACASRAIQNDRIVKQNK